MKIAVIGGGTAGYIAAAHLTKYFPDFELIHIFDSRIPTIGVGEGTTLEFPEWLEKITGLGYTELNQKYHVTQKFSISFENWGRDHPQYSHNFHPIGQAYAYHVAAENIVTLLQKHVTATHIDNKVIELKSNGREVEIAFEDQTNLKVDLAIDARGFPKTLNQNYLELSIIPTNAALIRQGSPVEFQTATRSIARPYGWIFVIPLTHRTSYGYIYNSSINTQEEIAADFDEFLRLENINVNNYSKQINFPRFSQRRFFDGALFTIGNAASFLEPLEATAIGAIIAQMKCISFWPLNLFIKKQQKCNLKSKELELFNNFLVKYTYKLSLFVGLHYAKGSCFNTDFWQLARDNFEREVENPQFPEVMQEFLEYLQQSYTLLHPFNKYRQFAELTSEKFTSTKVARQKISESKSFAQWDRQSFAEVGHGVGYFPQSA